MKQKEEINKLKVKSIKIYLINKVVIQKYLKNISRFHSQLLRNVFKITFPCKRFP